MKPSALKSDLDESNYSICFIAFTQIELLR